MGTFHDLTLQTATAVSRLAELQRRAERISERPSTITKSALAELSGALEELRVANEALQTQLDEMSDWQMRGMHARCALDELAEVTPIAVVWTDRTGVIEEANDSACQLLNAVKHQLIGKPLVLFISDSRALFAALRCLCEADHTASIDVTTTVRPRERRSRKMRLAGRRLEHDTRILWFIHGQQRATEEDIVSLAARV